MLAVDYPSIDMLKSPGYFLESLDNWLMESVPVFSNYWTSGPANLRNLKEFIILSPSKAKQEGLRNEELMAISMKDLDASFHGVGQKVGLEKWVVENSRPVPVARSENSKFHSEDSYIILQTTVLKSGVLHHDIHYWIGKDASEDAAITAATKGIELDAAIGGHAVQHREAEGFETDKFLSYFKPCFIPIDRGISDFSKATNGTYRNRLFVCKGRHAARLKEVPFCRSSLNHYNIFILDTESKIFQFNGATANKFERVKALEVVQYIKETYHNKDCEVAIIEDGRFVADADSGEFWNNFGGFAPLGKKVENDIIPEIGITSAHLFCIIEGQAKEVEQSSLRREVLDSNKCFIVDLGVELYAWLGRNTTLEARKSALLVAEELAAKRKIPCHLTCIIEGFEPREFRMKFEAWPQTQNTSVSEDGRGKVAVLLKQKGLNVKGLLKAKSMKEDPPLLLNDSGKLQVWRINHDLRTSLPLDEHGKFYSSDCYVLLYTYYGDQKEEYLLCTWIGNQSDLDTRAAANEETKQIAHTLREEAAQVRIFEGKEPALFLALFDRIFNFKGEMNHDIEESGDEDGFDNDDFTDQDVVMFEIRHPVSHTCQAVQVTAEASSLNSSVCFVVQTKSKVYTWFGKYSTVEEQELTESMVHSLKPGARSTPLKEGSEPEIFWKALGGRKAYPGSREDKEAAKDPHLYTCTYVKGDLKVTEVFNFAQDDLLSDDIMILDVYNGIFVWVGCLVKAELKQRGFEIGQKYLEDVSGYNRIPLNTPLYKISEGSEPSFFTAFFSWEPLKMHGDTFQKKLSVIKGQPLKTAEGLSRRRSSPAPTADRHRAYRGGTPTSSRKSYKSPDQDTLSDRGSVASLSAIFDTPGQERSVKFFSRKIPAVKAEGGSEKDSPVMESASCPPTPKSQRSSRSRSTVVAALSSIFETSSIGDGTPPRFPVKKKSQAVSVDGGDIINNKDSLNRRRSLSSFASFAYRSPAIAALTAAFESGSPVSDSSPALLNGNSAIQTSEKPAQRDSSPISGPETNLKKSERMMEKTLEDVQEDSVAAVEGAYTYAQLKASSADPVEGIDVSRRESYLSPVDFKKVFHVEKAAFYELPKWKQDRYKMMLDLF